MKKTLVTPRIPLELGIDNDKMNALFKGKNYKENYKIFAKKRSPSWLKHSSIN